MTEPEEHQAHGVRIVGMHAPGAALLKDEKSEDRRSG